MTTLNEDTLRVGRWHNELLVAQDSPDVSSVRDRIDRALQTDLSRALSAVLSGIGRGDRSIVLVRRLDVDWAIDAGWDTSGIAHQCAVALTREVLAELASPASGNVVRFGGPAEFLAAYIAARASGDGAASWLFARFSGWSALPASAAIRSALCEDPGVGLDALKALPRSTIVTMAAILEDSDVVEIVRQLSAAPFELSPDAAHATLQAGLDGCPRSLLGRAALGVWLLTRAPSLPTADGIRRVSIVIGALERAAARTGASLDELFRSIAADGSAVSALIASTAAGDGTILDRVAVRLVTNLAAASDDSRSSTWTSMGGAVLLLDDLFELDWEEVASEWPPFEGADTIGVLQLLTLGLALAADWRPMFDDPFWRDRFGLPAPVATADVEEWLARAGPECRHDLIDAAADVLRRFAQRLPGFGESGADHLRHNFLAIDATIELEPDRIVVNLSRAPLDLVLRMSGVNRGPRRWPLFDARPFVLFSEDR